MGIIWKYDLELLRDTLSMIDLQLEKLHRACHNDEMADQLGYFDRGEYVIGLGFVACQQFITSTLGRNAFERSQKLKIGPIRKAGLTVVEIVNHAANYWKHNDEWGCEANPRARVIIETFEQLGCSLNLDYPLSCVLSVLIGPDDFRFNTIIIKLEEWADIIRIP